MVCCPVQLMDVLYPTPAVDPDPNPSGQPPGRLPPDVDLDVSSRDLLTRLLQIEPTKRLRSVRTLETVAFYKGYSFKSVKDRKIKPNDLLEQHFPNGPPLSDVPAVTNDLEDFDSMDI